jgi:hypothetical protein
MYSVNFNPIQLKKKIIKTSTFIFMNKLTTNAIIIGRTFFL